MQFCQSARILPKFRVNNVEINAFPDDCALAEAAAEQWVAEMGAAVQASTRYCVALSGGRIARRLFTALAGMAKARPQPLSSVHFFWGDERCVPPNDPESNFGMARELLLIPCKVADENIHRVRGEDEPDSAAASAESELSRIAPSAGAGQPVIDLIFLGMGEDGHVASLFPNESEDAIAASAVYRAVTASKPPPRRITLGYPAIVAAKQVWVLASGAGKADALRESLRPSGQTPLARVLGLRQVTRIFTDIRYC